MIFPYYDPIVREKHETQKKILEEAGGDLREYSKIVKKEAQKLREKYKGKFKKVKTKILST